MKLERLGGLVRNLDSRRKPLNSVERQAKAQAGLYPYIGANNIVGYIDEYLFDEKILCLAEDGGSWGTDETCAVIYEGKTWVNNHAHVLIENGKANLEYLKYYLNHANLNKYITGTTRGKLTKSALESIQIPIPESFEDQIRIATVLSKAEALIAQRKESIRLLDEFLKSMFVDMFGDPVRNTKKWDQPPLEQFGNIVTGNTPSRNDDRNYSESHIEWVKTDNIISEELFVTEATEYLSEIGLSKARHVDSGALLVACIAGSIDSVGRAALTDRKVSFNQQINAIQPNSEVDAIFLYWLFRLSKLYVQSYASKGMKKIITKGVFEKIRMIRPNLKLQKDFAAVANKVQLLRSHYSGSLQILENLLKSLSQRAFKGELKLKDFEVTLLDTELPVDQFEKPGDKPTKRRRLKIGKEYGDPFEGKAIPEDRLMTLTEAKKILGSEYEEIYDEEKQSKKIDSAWLQARTLPVNERGRIKFNNAEGWAILDAIFFDRNFGFTSNEFIAFLQGEGIAFDSDAIANFFAKALDKKRIVQRYSKNTEVETRRTDSAKQENIIWFAHNVVDK